MLRESTRDWTDVEGPFLCVFLTGTKHIAAIAHDHRSRHF